ncbi:hypothetical protein COU18_00750 [Candidatus Kaiserbacteria bacterium CG10_big_fil_rev_8_21_14_0_10_51_14]|uniref:Uncharacterized protein n=1 Tax=Candidatus Kaiserbacteria bacterium CG10_big_fil_rev_8_21_14_0_10_51_14 TaxID=1974610 RepID=A0A2H0UBX7_9BACT|nr:MAG: hypothetical protein COU18_00750 [Candidatus Kaiserbacteria bacterium CG10_big_fil_rev_8_21_14_0_10_51_14]
MNNSSNTNTILIVIVLLVLVGGGVWWYKTYGPGAMAPVEDENNGLEINIGGNSDAMDGSAAGN